MRGRLAPSPTGLLHLGHARTFLIAAARAGGDLVLRNEDLDGARWRLEFSAAMLENLRWLVCAGRKVLTWEVHADPIARASGFLIIEPSCKT